MGQMRAPDSTRSHRATLDTHPVPLPISVLDPPPSAVSSAVPGLTRKRGSDLPSPEARGPHAFGGPGLFCLFTGGHNWARKHQMSTCLTWSRMSSLLSLLCTSSPASPCGWESTLPRRVALLAWLSMGLRCPTAQAVATCSNLTGLFLCSLVKGCPFRERGSPAQQCKNGKHKVPSGSLGHGFHPWTEAPMGFLYLLPHNRWTRCISMFRGDDPPILTESGLQAGAAGAPLVGGPTFSGQVWCVIWSVGPLVLGLLPQHLVRQSSPGLM